MEIRTMREDEAPAVSRIYAQSWKSARTGGSCRKPYLDALPEYRWTGILLQNPSRSFVLLSEGRYAGTAYHSRARQRRKAAGLGRGHIALPAAGLLRQGLRPGASRTLHPRT